MFFHFSFNFPLRYYFYCSVFPFSSPVLRGVNDLICVGLFCLVISVKGLTWVSASLLVQGGLIHTSFFSV